MEDIQSVKKQLLIMMKKDNIKNIQLNVSGILYIMNKIGDLVSIRIFDHNNVIIENTKIPNVHYCKGKTIHNKRCKNKTYNNFCHLH